jgi:hypothetical protein
MKKFLIAEAEKARILGMHYNAMGKTLVNEQVDSPEEFRKAGISRITPVSLDDVKDGRYAVSFMENTNSKEYSYNCATNPKFANEPWNKAGAIYDSTLKIVNDPFVLSNTPEFKAMMTRGCKAVFDYLAQERAKNAPKPQVAAATTTTVNAPNPVSDADVAARQKNQAEAKAKTEQATIDLKTLMDSPSGFLKTTDSDGNLITDKTTLDTQVKELDRVLTAGGIPTGAGQPTQDLLRSMSNLVKRFPEYGQVLNSHIYNLKQ